MPLGLPFGIEVPSDPAQQRLWMAELIRLQQVSRQQPYAPTEAPTVIDVPVSRSPPVKRRLPEFHNVASEDNEFLQGWDHVFSQPRLPTLPQQQTLQSVDELMLQQPFEPQSFEPQPATWPGMAGMLGFSGC